VLRLHFSFVPRGRRRRHTPGPQFPSTMFRLISGLRFGCGSNKHAVGGTARRCVPAASAPGHEAGSEDEAQRLYHPLGFQRRCGHYTAIPSSAPQTGARQDSRVHMGRQYDLEPVHWPGYAPRFVIPELGRITTSAIEEIRRTGGLTRRGLRFTNVSRHRSLAVASSVMAVLFQSRGPSESGYRDAQKRREGICETGLLSYGHCKNNIAAENRGARTPACRVETHLDASSPVHRASTGVSMRHARVRAPRRSARKCGVILA